MKPKTPNTPLKSRSTTELVVVHFTGKADTGFKQIRQEHLDRGLDEIGYHFVIEQDGTVLMGRHVSRVGAHHPEFDANSVGICVIGDRNEMSFEQDLALKMILQKLANDYPEAASIKYIYKEE